MTYTHFRWRRLIGALALSACNGQLTVLAEPVPLDTGASPVEPSSCPELSVGPSLFSEPFQQLIECGECRCDAGQAVCEQDECRPFQTMGRCPENSESWPEAQTARAHIQGDSLFLDAKGYGGCGERDLLPCYVQPALSTLDSQTMYPKTATIRVLNPTTYQDCPKVVFQQLQIGLRTLVEFRSDEGGLVNTTYGLAKVGELSCFDASYFATDQLLRSLQPLEPSSDSFVRCENDADCNPGFAVSCSGCVNLTSNVATQTAFAFERARIDAEACAPIAEACRDTYALSNADGSGCSALSAVCRAGSCVQVNSP